ncbi:MAG: Na(+)-translocating NADH-quinone reductase subunit A [Bacteroidales bacterium]|nr:Na(+)-translocating NADH-quinone reductase subunit A [Bacteroidales bacterium]MCF8455052.1 Na(+)-translocating NADH-quinone reductase subunit A [Bacteroidales bacterium]
MSKTIKIRKGLDIKLKGKAEKTLQTVEQSDFYAIKPTDFPGLTPKMDVKVGDEVKAGSPLFHDKYKENVLFTSPVSGKVSAINRGERRRILEIVVEADGKQEFEAFTHGDAGTMSREQIKDNLLKSGLWPFIRQRPYGIVANPADVPKSIHISGFDSAPLAPDMDFILQNQMSEFQKGIDALAKLTDGKVHLNLNGENTASPLKKTNAVEQTLFEGPHPAGNVGIQIHHIEPINKGDIVWYINPQDVVFVGRLFETGHYNVERIVALAGSEVTKPQYYRTMMGASIEPLVSKNVADGDLRYISGNVLTGTHIPKNGFIGFYDSLITVIPEGNYYEMFGWALPGIGKYSTSRSFFSWLTPNKEFKVDSNFHGGERAFVMSGEYDKVFPMDILPVPLIKAILAEDIDKMEQLGIYEVIEEDMALCEFVCTSKIEVQSILRKGLELMIKELG